MPVCPCRTQGVVRCVNQTIHAMGCHVDAMGCHPRVPVDVCDVRQDRPNNINVTHPRTPQPECCSSHAHPSIHPSIRLPTDGRWVAKPSTTTTHTNHAHTHSSHSARQRQRVCLKESSRLEQISLGLVECWGHVGGLGLVSECGEGLLLLEEGPCAGLPPRLQLLHQLVVVPANLCVGRDTKGNTHSKDGLTDCCFSVGESSLPPSLSLSALSACAALCPVHSRTFPERSPSLQCLRPFLSRSTLSAAGTTIFFCLS